MEINKYFEKQGSFYLNDINYKTISLEAEPKDIKTKYEDFVSTEIIENGKQLRVLFTRRIYHQPESLYELFVSFGAIYYFKKEYINSAEVKDIDFLKKFKENRNTLFLNIISRTSMLISQITSSHGKIPLVTPPLYMEKIR